MKNLYEAKYNFYENQAGFFFLVYMLVSLALNSWFFVIILILFHQLILVKLLVHIDYVKKDQMIWDLTSDEAVTLVKPGFHFFKNRHYYFFISTKFNVIHRFDESELSEIELLYIVTFEKLFPRNIVEQYFMKWYQQFCKNLLSKKVLDSQDVIAINQYMRKQEKMEQPFFQITSYEVK